MSNPKVLWRHEDGEIKGRIIQDAAGRTKIVFVGRNHRGRRPAHGETTEVAVEKDTQPEDARRGALLVRPIFAPDPAALSKDDAKARMLELIRARGLMFGEHWIDIDLPGWKGTIHGSRPKSHDGAVSVYWRYEADNGSLMIISGDDPSGYMPITQAIITHHGVNTVEDCAQALRDLGLPASVDALGDVARLTWNDTHGGRLIAKLPAWKAFLHDGRLEDVRMNEYGHVLGTITMIGGSWVIGDAVLAVGERHPVDKATISRAAFSPAYAYVLSTEVRSQVARLLRQNLHSEAWHRQATLQGLLSRQATWSTAAWHLVGELEKILADPLMSLDAHEACLRRIEGARERIRHVQERSAHFEGVGDKEIYTGDPIDDSAEVASLKAENDEGIRALDAKIEELRLALEQVPLQHANPDLPTTLWAELGLLLEQVEAFPATIAPGQPERIEEIGRWLYVVTSDLRQAISLMEAPGPIEAKLERFCHVRNAVRYRFEDVRERFAAPS